MVFRHKIISVMTRVGIWNRPTLQIWVHRQSTCTVNRRVCGFLTRIMLYLVLSGEFPYAQEPWHRFFKAFTAVRIIKSRRQIVQLQADFRRNSIVTIYFCSDVLIFVTIRFLTDFWVRIQCGCKILMRSIRIWYGFSNPMYSLWKIAKSWLRSAHRFKKTIKYSMSFIWLKTWKHM